MSYFNFDNDNSTISAPIITYGNYDLFSFTRFFGFTDPVRLIKLIYILISLILNLFIVTSIFLRKNNNKISLALEIILNILSINFLHALTYGFQWIIKEEGITLDIENYTYQVGGLLMGNPENPNPCFTQAFFLVFTSLSQDFLINIFFYIINKENYPNIMKIRLTVISLGYAFPLIFSLFYLFTDELGMNDRFCYVKKFNVYSNNNGLYDYSFNKNFKYFITTIYFIRTLNLFYNAFLYIKIILYIKKNSLNKKYICNLSFLLLIQMMTVIIGLIYRIGTFISDVFARKFAEIFLCLNTIDCVLFPLTIILTNDIPRNLYYSIFKKDYDINGDDGSDEGRDSGGINRNSRESLNRLSNEGSGGNQTFAMIEIKDNSNNYDLSLTLE